MQPRAPQNLPIRRARVAGRCRLQRGLAFINGRYAWRGRITLCFWASCLVPSLPGCGGSGNTSAQPAPTPPTISSVAVTCAPSSIGPNKTAQCSANVQGTGTFSAAVEWAASAGTITSGGIFTAPSNIGSITITATSTANRAESGTATVSVQFQTPPSRHVVVVMEENQSYATVVGNTSAWPNLNALMTSGALPTNYYANAHPSIGNYFMLTTGQ